MENKDLIEVIYQIKTYNLTKAFKDEKELKLWLSKLNNMKISNFLSLNISSDDIKFPLGIIVNEDLLNCSDYIQRIEALSKIKNGDGCWHLFDELCNSNFIKSKNFYKDLEMLSKADTAQYALCVLGKDAFINSPYHDEDLRLIVETHNIEDEELDYIVLEALATVAGNVDSINSPYHQADMKLIAESGSDCLQMSHSYPERCINALAINKISLNDKYHLENMQILVKNPVVSELLYIIMTDPYIVNGKNYRKEIDALINAKSKHTARALYYYIVNPEKKFKNDYDFDDDYDFDFNIADIVDDSCVAGRETPSYLENLEEINEVDDEFVMHYVSLLMNSNLINSPYIKSDLELLRSIYDKSIFMDLYRFITDETSLINPFHKSDAKLLSEILPDENRRMILEKIMNEDSLKSPSREFDLKYISALDLDNIDKKLYQQIYHYLFSYEGINDKDHIEVLKRLQKGIIIEDSNPIEDYLNTLLEQLENGINEIEPLIDSTHTDKKKPKILSIF